MPIIPTGLFDSFDNLDQISVEAVSSWLKPAPQLTQLKNYLANKILYPRSLPLTKQDMQIDLAILCEALKMNAPKGSQKLNALLGDNPFLNITLRKILIPSKFLDFVPNLATLTTVFINALLFDRTREDWFQDIWTIVLVGISDEVVGSVILPQFEDKNALMRCQLLGKNYEIRPGGLTVLPCLKDRCEIRYKLHKGKILGKEESAIEIYGGKLGLVIDGRSV
ncbi:MAG: hypothetical protein PHV63_04175 [Candidatus Daviesbacteria bacterium]|nr:hypothetical protein [Candidatus Daviesbacteria bacterium]